MQISTVGNQYIAAFDPREYLQECFSEPDDEYRFGIQFLLNTLHKLPRDLFVLEFGAGPALHSVAALAPYAREIHFSDYVPASLLEVQQWLDDTPNAYNWHPFIKIILEKEGINPTPQLIAKRESEMRRKVTRLMRCDAFEQAPLGHNAAHYDLVLAPHCTDVAASTVEEWMQVMENITTLVKPGGWLLVSITTGATLNTVGRQVFSCVNLSDQDMIYGFVSTGYNPDTLHLDKTSVPFGHEYSGATYAVAQKNVL